MSVILLWFLFFSVVSWLIYWKIPRLVSHRTPKIPPTVPQEWIEEYREKER
jgi:hypothetical protein